MSLQHYFNKSSIKYGLWGAIGALLSEILNEFIFDNNIESHSFIENFIEVSIWIGLIAIGITLALLIKNYKDLNKELKYNVELRNLVIKHVLYGAMIGGIAQIVYSIIVDFSGELGRILCWGIAGAGLGFNVAKIIPNYPENKGRIAGFVGGIIGGILFVIFSDLFNSVLGRFFGVASIGFFIGLLISVFEQLYRKAWIKLKWSENEFSSITLGSKPIVIGSGAKSDIYLPRDKNYPSTTAIITFINGRITIDDKLSNKQTELRDGSVINLGFVELIINTQK
jgi:Ca-activated chloride channel family protein